MSPLRSVLFWLHLVTGVLAGAVILVMCVTGVALTYEKQMLEWADRGPGPVAGASAPLSPEALLTVAGAESGATPTALTLRADRRAPALVTFEGNRSQLIDPSTGQGMGEPSPRLRQFFRLMTNWHRWLAMEGASRATGRLITGASNLGFLFIVVSGMYLWLPKVISWVQLRQVLWFRGALTPKARDFNWHNVIGIWSALPLALVVAGAVPISYGWAGNLVYRLAGEVPPSPPASAGAVTGTAPRPGGPEARTGRTDAGGRARVFSASGLDAAFAASTAAVPGWRTASVRFGAAAAPYTIAVDEGGGGQPQFRTTFTIDRATARITRRETFADLGPGRQWRSWFRFVHTGEYYGLAGQTIAGLASAGAAVLVYTGVALALRRFVAWRRRRATTKPHTVAA